MYNQILQKQAELKNKITPDLAFKEWLEQSDIYNWIYSVFKVTGKDTPKEVIASIVLGELRDDVSLSDYTFAEACKNVYRDIKGELSMQADLDLRMLQRWAEMLMQRDAKKPSDLYRQNNPVVFEWDLVPTHFRSIDEELDKLFRFAAKETARNPLDLAAFVHLEINRVYPYGEDSVLAASTALVYYLLKLGLPVPELSASDIEYNNLNADYFAGKDSEAFTDMLFRSVMSRLEVVEQNARRLGLRSEE